MAKRFSEEATDRARAAVDAAGALSERAEDVSRVCRGAHPMDVIVAVVNPDGAFGGAWAVPAGELLERVGRLPVGGWALTFTPGTDADDVRSRCAVWGKTARRRWELLRRRAERPKPQ